MDALVTQANSRRSTEIEGALWNIRITARTSIIKDRYMDNGSVRDEDNDYEAQNFFRPATPSVLSSKKGN